MELNNSSQNSYGASQDKITYFAETDFRNKKLKFGIKAKDRTRHLYIIGKTGMGKSTMLENMAVQDIQNGEGMAFIDPHGGTAEKILDYVPEDRVKDVIYFAPFDSEYPVSFNVMEDVGPDKRHLVANGLMNAFKKIWVDAWSARMEYILNNVLLALLEYPDSTILGVNRMLSDKDYRNLVVANVTDASVKSFWVDEFAKYGDKYMQEAGAAIQNKIGQFISNPLIRNIIGQPKSSFNVREIMDNKKILIMNLSKGRMGIENSSLLGNMLVTKIYLGAMSRADASASELQKLPNFYFYVDEFQSFANESFADILSEARKYKLSLTIAHQYVNQMPEEVRDAVFGNVGSMVTFRIGPEDAELFEKEFAPEFVAEDLVNLGFAQVYMRLMIDGIGSKPFSATTLPPISLPDYSYKDKIIETTRKTHATPRAQVEATINEWYAPVPSSKPQKDRGIKNDVAGKSPNRASLPSPLSAKELPPHPTAAVYMPKAPPIINVAPSPERPEKTPGKPVNEPIRRVEATILTQPKEAPKEAPKEQFKPKNDVLQRQAPVSLDKLKSRPDSGPSKNNIALKEALASALKERVPAKEEKTPGTIPQNNPPKINEPAVNKIPEPEKKENPAPVKNDAPKEVPEDVLLKILLGE